MEQKDTNPIILTLDAGGTNFVFSAMQDGKEIAEPMRLPSEAADLGKCLANLRKGFSTIMGQLSKKPAAISFAFPGPADYAHGIIGDLPNFPSFRGGIALGPYLEEVFGIPAFINNDGNLFAYGEAMAGLLPEVNRRLREQGCSRQYKNLMGITLGTGFGCGVVIDGKLLTGDNGLGGDIWCFRNKKYHDYIAEESVSIRAVKRVYRELTSDTADLTPYDIYLIAEGQREGNAEAARQAFVEMGELAGDAIAQALTIVDGLVVIGGGLAGASKYIIPSLVKEMNSQLGSFAGNVFPRMQMRSFNLDCDTEFAQFATDSSHMILIPETDKSVAYDPESRVGVGVSKLGASKAIALGAYHYAVNNL